MEKTFLFYSLWKVVQGEDCSMLGTLYVDCVYSAVFLLQSYVCLSFHTTEQLFNVEFASNSRFLHWDDC